MLFDNMPHIYISMRCGLYAGFMKVSNDRLMSSLGTMKHYSLTVDGMSLHRGLLTSVSINSRLISHLIGHCREWCFFAGIVKGCKQNVYILSSFIGVAVGGQNQMKAFIYKTDLP